MKNLSVLFLMMLATFTSFGQEIKYKTIKQWKGGKVVSSKTIITKRYEVVKIKYVPVKQKSKPIIVEVPVKVVVRDTVKIADNRKIDSLSTILSGYQLINTKIDVIKLKDGLGTVTIKDEVSGNQLVKRDFSYDIKPKTVKEFIDKTPPPTNGFYMGPTASTNFIDEFNTLGVAFALKTKNDNSIIQLNVGHTMRTRVAVPSVYLGIGYLLRVR
jgi:hypothetical protein